MVDRWISLYNFQDEEQAMPGKRLRKRGKDEFFDWTGPWISDGKWQASTQGYTTARNEWEQTSKEHDISYANAQTKEDFDEADNKYFEGNFGKGFQRSAAALAVRYGGPLFHSSKPTRGQLAGNLNEKIVRRPTQSNLPAGTQAPMLRGAKRKEVWEEPEAKRVAVAPDGTMTSIGGNGGNVGGGGVTAAAFTAGGGGSTGGTMGETPVIPYGKVTLIQPDYFTCKHKWTYTGTQSKDTGAISVHEFRVNSPIDPNITNTTATGTGVTYNDINSRFNGFNELASRYRYYRLLENRVTITFLRVPYVGVAGDTMTAISNWNLSKLPMAVGFIMNPSNRYEVNSSSITDWKQFANARFTDWRILTGENGRSDFTFTYRPGTWDAAIAEQQKEKLWTPVHQHQTPDDRIALFWQTIEAQGDFNLEIVVHMEITVQYREWDNQIVERMFLHDEKDNARLPPEIPRGATTAFTSADTPPAPDTYEDHEME